MGHETQAVRQLVISNDWNVCLRFVFQVIWSNPLDGLQPVQFPNHLCGPIFNDFTSFPDLNNYLCEYNVIAADRTDGPSYKEYNPDC